MVEIFFNDYQRQLQTTNKKFKIGYLSIGIEKQC